MSKDYQLVKVIDGMNISTSACTRVLGYPNFRNTPLANIKANI